MSQLFYPPVRQWANPPVGVIRIVVYAGITLMKNFFIVF
jgi:hypothetical protein